MEADWEFEIGGDAPVIEAQWAGFVDLRCTPGAAWRLDEAKQLPSLGAALEMLNLPDSGVWTSKCDFYQALQAEDFEGDEMDAGSGSCTEAVGCYIDILPRATGTWGKPSIAEAACRQVCGALGQVKLRCCRVDLIVRSAVCDVADAGLGITAYVSACGLSNGEARDTLQFALAAFADAVYRNSTLQLKSVGE